MPSRPTKTPTPSPSKRIRKTVVIERFSVRGSWTLFATFILPCSGIPGKPHYDAVNVKISRHAALRFWGCQETDIVSYGCWSFRPTSLHHIPNKDEELFSLLCQRIDDRNFSRAHNSKSPSSVVVTWDFRWRCVLRRPAIRSPDSTPIPKK